ncbi:uncharacterized protein GIQ15_04275 [Arthroderma uncinatum]|uniref:uncharacterized protein n=1 Tax=Arthroderma uncinatum TaxID=74035 RepID=UPI00144AAA6E|nr:uncharacterized protein GIQ15_04275 [Arthroderma uncinatum]KAF3481516.1 hypothetical protein GIQ15_04275 [Arthroderma uncinatum]
MRALFPYRSHHSSRLDSITPAPDIPWSLVGSANEGLQDQLEHLYWEGIKGELENIIRTLKAWEQPGLTSVTIEDEQDDHIHGFDTFISQVSQESRAFAIRYGKKREEWEDARKNKLLPPKASYKDTLINQYLDQMAEYNITELKFGVRQAIEVSSANSATGFTFTEMSVIKGENHLSTGGFGSIQCGILKLGEHVALAKYKGLQTIVGLKANKNRPATISGVKATPNEDNTKPKKIPGWRPGKLMTVADKSLHDSATRSPSESSTSVATEAQADGDIPLFFRKFTEKYPFGNVHMALRVGPLVIENGVSHAKRGALVTVRETPVFHQRFDLVNSCDRCFSVSEGNSGRLLWQQKTRPRGLSKRFKAIMKQVVGVPFSGILDNESLESQIVEDIVVASKLPFDDPGLSGADQRSLLDSAIGPLLAKLQSLMGWRVKVYIESISNRLLDLKTNISWSLTGNNCQSFCNAILEPDLFEPLLNGPERKSGPYGEPLYLMSFVCPQDGYQKRKVRTKFDVPIGLTEEYLLKFHFGRHDEADIIDTLLEYWYDWGAFAAPLYKYQDLFPWDCTEAYGKYPTRCGDCNLAKHVWAFPFDSWSMVALHLARDQHLYAPDLSKAAETKPKPAAWMENRLLVLTASYLLTRAAVAMAKTPKFCSATSWLHSKKRGLRAEDPSLSRVKLGGIHRAQPFSHYFEAGTYSHYFIAEWALLSRRDQIEAYELMRDGRIKLLDVPYAFSSRSRFEHTSDGSSNFSGFDGIGSGIDAAGPTHSGLSSFEDGPTHYDAGLSVYSPSPDAAACGEGVLAGVQLVGEVVEVVEVEVVEVEVVEVEVVEAAEVVEAEAAEAAAEAAEGIKSEEKDGE